MAVVLRRRVLAFVLLFAIGGCSRSCERKRVASADAGGSRDAQTDVTSNPQSELSPIAIASSGSRLHVLADGALLYSHGMTIDRLHDDGRREHLTTLRVPLDQSLETAPIGTVGGTLEDWLFVSVVEDQYPSRTISRSSRFRSGGKAERILRDDLFYLRVARWNDGRLLALRATGAVKWSFNSAPWVPDRFVVLAGTPTTAPQIPPEIFIEDFVAFDSGAVLAAATNIDGALVQRRSALVLRWTKDGGVPDVDRPPSKRGDRIERIAARSEDDVWVAGRTSDVDLLPAWLAHWDGKEWRREDAPFEGWVKSLSVARDGTLFAVSDGMIGRVPNALYRRSPATGEGDAGAWARVELPDLKEATFAKPPPRTAYVGGALRVDRRRAPQASALEPVEVVARGPGVAWVVAQTEIDSVQTSLLLRLGAGGASLADLDDEEASFSDDRSFPAGPKCDSLFVSAGEPTETARNRVTASSGASSAPVVIARLDGTRVLGSAIQSREDADDLANTWRKLALPVQIRCARPPILELVVDPDARDD